MAINFPKLNFFNKLDARARVLVVFGAIIGFILIIYLSTRFFLGGSSAAGPSSVASAPAGVQSIPGGTLTPDYQRALEQANQQLAQQAQMQGTTAIPTAINYGGSQTGTSGCIICTDQTANVKDYLDDWLKKGRISPEVANALQALADRNVSPEEYAAYLDRLVKEGKLTPEQARMLLEQYKKQHGNKLLQDSAQMMDNLIKDGRLPLDSANSLLEAQRNKLNPSDYAQLLQNLVKAGKITPETAQQLLAQYAQQRAKEVIQQSIVTLRAMSAKGQITPDILRELIDFETRMIPLDTFNTNLQRYVSAGKLTPAVADEIIKEYADQKNQIGPAGSVNDMLQKAEAAAYQELADLLSQRKITQDVADQIATLIRNNVPFSQFQAVIEQMVAQRKLTPEIAKLKLGDYQQVKGLRDLSQRLASLRANNAAANQYADALRSAVQAGLLSPEQAGELMRQYQALKTPLVGPTPATAGGTTDFNQLAQRVAQGAAAATPVAGSTEFTTAQTQVQTAIVQDRQQQINALLTAMSAQAQQLVAVWQTPPTILSRVGVTQTKKTTTQTATNQGAKTTSTAENQTAGPTGPVIIKAGTIYFAVLDTAVNSDYPMTPVLATIVEGPFKGAKLMGKLNTEKNVAGQLDRVSLNFTVMNTDEWNASRSVTAYAIDPDTARTVMASSVNYHYLKRFGAMFATSFLQGYASAITTSGSTSTTGIFGTSTQYPQLDPRQKLMVGLGQVGQALGSATQAWTNIPPTVRVDSGVGIGILFMSDVS